MFVTAGNARLHRPVLDYVRLACVRKCMVMSPKWHMTRGRDLQANVRMEYIRYVKDCMFAVALRKPTDTWGSHVIIVYVNVVFTNRPHAMEP